MGGKSILLKKNDLFRGLMSVELLYDEIESVLYVEAPKRPREVLFKVKGKTYSLRPRIDIFKFAPILRYFKTIGIVVRLQEKTMK